MGDSEEAISAAPSSSVGVEFDGGVRYASRRGSRGGDAPEIDGSTVGGWRAGQGDGLDPTRRNVAAGYAFMPKKMDSMSRIVAVQPPRDGVEFFPLDFSKPPEQHRYLDVILHKLSDDIMFRNASAEGERRLRWIEGFLSLHPETIVIDPFENVAKVINRVLMLEHVEKACESFGAGSGMPRTPRFVVLGERRKVLAPGEIRELLWRIERREGLAVRGTGDEAGEGRLAGGAGPWSAGVGGLHFPVICKPIEACGTRSSHTMIVVLDEAGMDDVPVPIIVQEFRNHGGVLFKVNVAGEDVRVFRRASLPDLRSMGLTGSFTFDSQKPYPSLLQVGESGKGVHGSQLPAGAELQKSLESNKKVMGGGIGVHRASEPTSIGTPPTAPASPGAPHNAIPSPRSQAPGEADAGQPVNDLMVWEENRRGGGEEASVSLEVARRAAACIRDAFGLSLFGFDLIIDSDSGEVMVIDINFFPSFRDEPDFPEVLRRRLKDVAAGAKRYGGTQAEQGCTLDDNSSLPLYPG